MFVQASPKPKILIVHKQTRWERDLSYYGSKKRLQQVYNNPNLNDNNNNNNNDNNGEKKLKNTSLHDSFSSPNNEDSFYNKTLESHYRQKNSLQKLQESLEKQAIFIVQAELPSIQLGDPQLIISLGGDNHFIYISSVIKDTPIMGVNSDPYSSTGALLYFNTISCLEHLKPWLATNDPLEKYFSIEKWKRIGTKLERHQQKEKKDLRLASAEINIHNSTQGKMSRFLIRKNQESWEEIKCSGLILATGSGSSGWYRNAHLNGENVIFSKQANFFRGIARENNYTKRKHTRYQNIQVNKDEKLEVISYMDGEILIDSNIEERYPFPHGSKATFYVHQQNLHVVDTNSPS